MSTAQEDRAGLARAYHRILLREVAMYGRPVGGEDGGLRTIYIPNNEAMREECLSRRALRDLVGEEAVDKLVEEGFLLRLDPEGDCLRSFHMDLLIRTINLPLKPGAPPLTLNAVYGLNLRPIPYRSEMSILPGSGSGLPLALYERLRAILGREFARILVSALKDYFRELGSQGFSRYQATAILKMLENWHNSEAFSISAPTGTGKTEIFMIAALVDILEGKAHGESRRVFVTYPRKMLEQNQAERFAVLLYHLNKHLRPLGLEPIRLYIRDGDTKKLQELLNSPDRPVRFRGLRFHGSPVLVDLNGRLTANGESLDFIVPLPGPAAKLADIVLTTAHTLLYRAATPRIENDIDYLDVMTSSTIVIDEAHEYEPIILGSISYLVESIRALTGSAPRIIVSSATLPNHTEIAKRLSSPTASIRVTDLSFEALSKYSGAPIILGEKAEIFLFAKMKPTYSWVPLTSQLSLYLLFLSWASKAENRGFVPQSIVFINNIRELNRAASVLEQAAHLGSPLDKTHAENASPMDPRYLVHTRYAYPRAYKTAAQRREEGSIHRELTQMYNVVFSGVPLQERTRIYEEFTSGKLSLLLATSSLELGVDYPNVSIIVNAGFDKPASLIQRFGRAGRSPRTLYTALNILVARNNPLDYYKYSNYDDLKSIVSGIPPEDSKPSIGTSIPSLQTYAILRHLLLSILKSGTRPPRTRGVKEAISRGKIWVEWLSQNAEKHLEEARKYAANAGIPQDRAEKVIKEVSQLKGMSLNKMIITLIEIQKIKDYIDLILYIIQNLRIFISELENYTESKIPEIHIIREYYPELTEISNEVLHIKRMLEGETLSNEDLQKIKHNISNILRVLVNIVSRLSSAYRTLILREPSAFDSNIFNILTNVERKIFLIIKEFSKESGD